MGGGELYAQTIAFATRLEVTEVDIDAPGDAFAPPIAAEWRETSVDPAEGWHMSPAGLRYRFMSYSK
jgi:dihydrofolate reductase